MVHKANHIESQVIRSALEERDLELADDAEKSTDGRAQYRRLPVPASSQQVCLRCDVEYLNHDQVLGSDHERGVPGVARGEKPRHDDDVLKETRGCSRCRRPYPTGLSEHILVIDQRDFKWLDRFPGLDICKSTVYMVYERALLFEEKPKSMDISPYGPSSSAGIELHRHCRAVTQSSSSVVAATTRARDDILLLAGVCMGLGIWELTNSKARKYYFLYSRYDRYINVYINIYITSFAPPKRDTLFTPSIHDVGGPPAH